MSSEYIQFLDWQVGRFGEGRKQRLYAAMHVQGGDRVLDAGCGPGTDTLALAQIVGPTGRVVGLDIREEMVVTANQRAREAGVAGWVEHKVCDVSSMPFEDGYFDACHAERLFMHLHQPGQAFFEMARVTRPGGWIATVSFDWATLSIDTPEAEIERKISAYIGALHNNPYAGRQLYRFYKQQGFSDILVDTQLDPITDLATADALLFLKKRAEQACSIGVVTRNELERFRASLEEADRIGAFFCQFSRVTIVGCKPDM